MKSEASSEQAHDETFRKGDVVEKYTGDYKWEGVVSVVFQTPDDKTRIVVAHPVIDGWVLHIYSPKNLRHVR